MPTKTPAPESDVQDFANMSAALTGFLSSVLKPALDPVGLARTYYEFALTQDAATMTALLAAYLKIQTQPPQTIADTLLEITPPDKTPPKTAPVTAPPPSPQALWCITHAAPSKSNCSTSTPSAITNVPKICNWMPSRYATWS